MNFIPKGPIDNKPALVHIMALRRQDGKPLSESMMIWFTDAYLRHSTLISDMSKTITYSAQVQPILTNTQTYV